MSWIPTTLWVTLPSPESEEGAERGESRAQPRVLEAFKQMRAHC